MRRHDLDRVSDMLVLVRAVETGSLSAAGRSLAITPAVASKRILRLEARLGVPLLIRTPRHLELTEAGRVFHSYALHILETMEEAEAATMDGRAKAQGRLRVTATTHLGRRQVGPALAAFTAQHPGVTAELILSDTVFDPVKERIDVAIRIGMPEDSPLVARRLAPNRRVVCGAPDYLARHGAPAVPADLLRHNCLVLDRPEARRDVWFFNTPDGPAKVRVSGSLQSNNGEVLRDWALAGEGLVSKSQWDVRDDLQAGRLVEVLAGFPSNDMDIVALYPNRKYMSAATRGFLDFMARRFNEDARECGGGSGR